MLIAKLINFLFLSNTYKLFVIVVHRLIQILDDKYSFSFNYLHFDFRISKTTYNFAIGL